MNQLELCVSEPAHVQEGEWNDILLFDPYEDKTCSGTMSDRYHWLDSPRQHQQQLQVAHHYLKQFQLVLTVEVDEPKGKDIDEVCLMNHIQYIHGSVYWDQPNVVPHMFLTAQVVNLESVDQYLLHSQMDWY
jgi:hypothetical protein